MGNGPSISDMLTSEANKNPAHPKHAETRAAINRHYEQRYGKPTTDVLLNGCDKLVAVIRQLLAGKN